MKTQVTHLNLLQLLRLRNFKQEIILQASEKMLLQYILHSYALIIKVIVLQGAILVLEPTPRRNAH